MVIDTAASAAAAAAAAAVAAAAALATDPSSAGIPPRSCIKAY
jgi:hypothetical protein